MVFHSFLELTMVATLILFSNAFSFLVRYPVAIPVVTISNKCSSLFRWRKRALHLGNGCGPCCRYWTNGFFLFSSVLHLWRPFLADEYNLHSLVYDLYGVHKQKKEDIKQW